MDDARATGRGAVTRAGWLNAVRKTTGYALFVLSCLGWLVVPVFPFLPMSTAAKAAWVAGALIFAEVTWWLMVLLLGKEVIEYCQRGWRWLKQAWPRRRRGPWAPPLGTAASWPEAASPNGGDAPWPVAPSPPDPATAAPRAGQEAAANPRHP